MFDRALKVVRQYHRLSQSDFADRIGISRSYVNELENGKKEPSIEILRKYSEFFDIPMSSLMLFAEGTDNGKADNVRLFAADKILRMLEWLSDGLDDGAQGTKTKPRAKNSAQPVSSIRA